MLAVLGCRFFPHAARILERAADVPEAARALGIRFFAPVESLATLLGDRCCDCRFLGGGGLALDILEVVAEAVSRVAWRARSPSSRRGP